MVKAIIFDCFGVLAEDGWGLIDDKLKPSDKQWQEMSQISHQADKGLLDISELESEFARVLNVDENTVSRIVSSQRKNYPLLNLISKLKQGGYKIAMISNVSNGFIDDYFSKQEAELFDEMTLSFALGYTKPDRRIYLLTANKLGLEPEECLFIDDNQVNVTGAEQAGMLGCLYQGLNELKVSLADLNVELAG